MVEYKQCNGCGEVKPYSEFYKHVDCMDGYNPKCKVCVKDRVRKYEAANKDKIKEKNKRRYKPN